MQDLLLSRMVWFIRNVDWSTQTLEAVVGRFRSGVAAVEAGLGSALDTAAQEAIRRRTDALAAAGAPPDLAARLAAMPALEAAPDIVMVAEKSGRPIPDVAAIHFAVASRFRLDALMASSREIPAGDYYDRLALDRALATIERAHRLLTSEVAGLGLAEGAAAVDEWARRRGPSLDRIVQSVEAIAGSGLSLSKLTVAASLLADLAGP